MNRNWKRSACLVLGAVLLVLVSVQEGLAEDVQIIEEAGQSAYPRFGGPNSVAGQMADDEALPDYLTGTDALKRYFEWKDSLQEKHGLSYTLDYTTAMFGATNTINGNDFLAGGALRFFGSWDLIGRDSGNTGSFVFKVEHRHGYTDPSASGVASEVGYAGLVLPVISDIGTRLTNLFWKQKLNEGRVEIYAGMIDATDLVDVYMLASPWSGFYNFALATGSATIPVPDDATLGVYLNAMLTDNLYIIGGFADANADSTDPLNGFDTFFSENEYFKSVELGWTTSQDRFYLDNCHVTMWHADQRVRAGVASGWGAAFSLTHTFGTKWMPFFRGGYADDGGTLLQKSLSTGIGYHLDDEKSLLGVGLNWGQPNSTTLGSGLDDQYSIEMFARLQVAENLQITPDIQYMLNPALNPGAGHSWVFGLRARMYF